MSQRVPMFRIRLMAAGLLLLQLVWVFAVPPFRAADEFDHVYRAAAAARGDWRPEATNATRGTGAFVTVPDDIVAAAQPECSRLLYTKAHDCVGTAGDAGTTVSTGAGRYHPAFYALIGTVALPFDGAAALYAMRLTNVLLCFIAFVAALVSLRRWATSAWPYVAFTLACSPMVLFNTSIAAPNGLEMAASLALWVSLFGLARNPARSGHGLLVVAVASAITVVTLRSLGPLWVFLIVVSVAVAAQLSRCGLSQLVRRRDVQIGAGVVAAATAASLWWIASASSLVIGTLEVPDSVSADGPVVMYARSMTLWVLQSIAAFPYRDQAASPVLYAAYLLLVAWLLSRAVGHGQSSQRITLVGLAALSLAIPVGITAATIDRHGLSWNGGYTLPFSMGLIVAAGAVLNDRSPRLPTATKAALCVAYVTAHVIGPVGVLSSEMMDSPSVSSGTWTIIPVPIAVGLALVGAALLSGGATLGADSAGTAQHHGALRSTRLDHFLSRPSAAFRAERDAESPS